MRKPNILLIVLDATRYDYCSCYGYDRLTTPNLDHLAEEGVLFENAISPAPWTLPAFAAILTGLYPSQTGIYITRMLDPQYDTIARVLGRHGYCSFIISSNSWLSTDFGLVNDFDTIHKLWQLWQIDDDVTSVNVIYRTKNNENIYRAAVKSYLLKKNAFQNVINYIYYRITQRIDTGASRTLGPFKRWLAKQNGPWFAVIHFMEAHLPYRPPRSWWQRFARNPRLVRRLHKADQRRIFWRHNAGVEQLTEEELEAWRDLYAAEVAYQDAYLGQLLNWLRITDQYDSTCIIVVGDHGENLGEHGLLNHQYCLYEPLIHVPLIIRYPPYFSQGNRVSTLVSTLDIYQTIMDVAGVKGPRVESRSLLEATARPFVISEYGTPRTPPMSILSKFGLTPQHLKRFERGLTALRTDQYKLIVGTDGSLELYDIQADPAERTNLASQRLDLVEQFKAMLADWQQVHETSLVDQQATIEEVDPSVVERLRELGYLD